MELLTLLSRTRKKLLVSLLASDWLHRGPCGTINSQAKSEISRTHSPSGKKLAIANRKRGRREWREGFEKKRP